MSPTDGSQGAGSPPALPQIAVEAVLIERMMSLVSENTSNVSICGESILMLQQKVEALSAAVMSLVEAYRRQSGPQDGNGRKGDGEPSLADDVAVPPGHAGYTVKEFAELTKRSKSYVYRLILQGQVAKNMAGLITHQSLLRMRMSQAGRPRRQRKSKWA